MNALVHRTHFVVSDAAAWLIHPWTLRQLNEGPGKKFLLDSGAQVSDKIVKDRYG